MLSNRFALQNCNRCWMLFQTLFCDKRLNLDDRRQCGNLSRSHFQPSLVTLKPIDLIKPLSDTLEFLLKLLLRNHIVTSVYKTYFGKKSLKLGAFNIHVPVKIYEWPIDMESIILLYRTTGSLVEPTQSQLTPKYRWYRSRPVRGLAPAVDQSPPFPASLAPSSGLD